MQSLSEICKQFWNNFREVHNVTNCCCSSVDLSLDQSSELGEALKKSQLELAAALNKCQHLEQEYTSLREQAGHHSASQDSFQQQLELRECTIAQLTEEGICTHTHTV